MQYSVFLSDSRQLNNQTLPIKSEITGNIHLIAMTDREREREREREKVNI